MKKICLLLIFGAFTVFAKAQTDSILLLDFFDALRGNEWQDISYRWNPNTPVSTWKGVTVRNGRVVAIDLDGDDDGTVTSCDEGKTSGVGMPQNVSLELPLSLPEALEILSLSGNGANIMLDGALNCPNLEKLSLSGNAITALPSSFPFLNSLQSFCAGINQISGTLPRFPNSKGLKELEFRFNRFSGPIPDYKADNPGLLTLSLRGNDLDGLVPFLDKNGHFLFVSQNRFTFEDMWVAHDSSVTKGSIEYFEQDSVPVQPLWKIGLGLPRSIDIGIDKNVPHPLTYLWFKEGYSGVYKQTTSPVLDFATVQPGDAGRYWCHIRNAIMTEDTLETLPFRIEVCQPAIWRIDTFLCSGSSLTVRGIRYDRNNPTGQTIIPGAAADGCDSVYNVRLQFRNVTTADQITCSDEGPFDIQVLTTRSGGRWRADTDAFIENPAAFNTRVSQLDPGANRFVWEQPVSGCPGGFFRDTVTITHDVPPVAMPDFFIVFTGKTKDTLITENDDFTPDNDRFELIRPPRHGTLEIDDENAIQYKPDNTFLGRDTFFYRLCPLACDASFCDTALVVILVVPEKTPNIISADDNGINDALIIKPLTPDANAFPRNRLLIVNEWGSAVFESSPYTNDWRGTNQSGGELPQATYYYFFWSEKTGSLSESGSVAIRRSKK